MDMQNKTPVWMRAFDDWANQMQTEWCKRMNCAPDEISSNICKEASREFVAGMDWDVCEYCLGPCGDCKEKQREHPRCDPCPQDQSGYTECDYCPIRLLKRVHRMRFREIE